MVAEPVRLVETEEPEIEAEELAALELPQLERTCPHCSGVGLVSGDFAGEPAKPCPACHGEGKVPVYAVTTYEHAMRVAEALAAVAAQARERAEAFAARIERLMAEKEAALRPLERRAERLRQLLTEYHARLLERDRRAKSVPLCSGVKLVSRTTDHWNYEDEQALAEWLHANAPDLVRVKIEPAKAELKKAAEVRPDGTVVLAATGEIVPGVVVSRETTFDVKVEL